MLSRQKFIAATFIFLFPTSIYQLSIFLPPFVFQEESPISLGPRHQNRRGQPAKTNGLLLPSVHRIPPLSRQSFTRRRTGSARGISPLNLSGTIPQNLSSSILLNSFLSPAPENHSDTGKDDNYRQCRPEQGHKLGDQPISRRSQ